MEHKKNCGCGKDPCITYGAELVTPKFNGHDKCLECGNIEVPVSEMDGGEIGLTDYYFSCADCDFSWYVSVKTDEHEDGERAYVSNEVGFIDEDGNIHQEPQEFNIMGQPNLVYEKYQEWDSLMDAESNGANDDISLMMSIIDEIEANDIWNETINEMIRRGKAVRRPDGKVIFSDRVPQFDVIEDIAQYTTPKIKSAENSDFWMTFGRVDYNWITDPEDLELTDENFSIIDAHIRDEVRYVIDNDADNSSGESNISSGDLNLTQEDEDEFTIYYYWGSPFTTGVNSAESFEAQEGLSSFTPKELTESSAIHGDFDHASINYSGHQNLIARAEGQSMGCNKCGDKYPLLDYNCHNCSGCSGCCECASGPQMMGMDAEENIAIADPSFWMNYPITGMLATAGLFAIGKTLLNSRKGDI